MRRRMFGMFAILSLMVFVLTIGLAIRAQTVADNWWISVGKTEWALESGQRHIVVFKFRWSGGLNNEQGSGDRPLRRTGWARRPMMLLRLHPNRKVRHPLRADRSCADTPASMWPAPRAQCQDPVRALRRVPAAPPRTPCSRLPLTCCLR